MPDSPPTLAELTAELEPLYLAFIDAVVATRFVHVQAIVTTWEGSAAGRRRKSMCSWHELRTMVVTAADVSDYILDRHIGEADGPGLVIRSALADVLLCLARNRHPLCSSDEAFAIWLVNLKYDWHQLAHRLGDNSFFDPNPSPFS